MSPQFWKRQHQVWTAVACDYDPKFGLVSLSGTLKAFVCGLIDECF
jgi:hypothetical protein